MPDDFTFRVATGGSVTELFADAPKAVLVFMKRGFRLLSTLGSEHYGKLIRTAGANLQSGHLAGQVVPELASAINTTKDDSLALLAVASLVVSVFTQRTETPDQFVKAAEEAGVLEAEAVPAVLAFCKTVLDDRDTLAVTVERARIGIEVLPSFEGLSATTDVRLGFKDGRVDLAVPVVVALLRTDSSKNLWFQLTKEQLQMLISKLQDAMRNVELAEQWISGDAGGRR